MQLMLCYTSGEVNKFIEVDMKIEGIIKHIKEKSDQPGIAEGAKRLREASREGDSKAVIIKEIEGLSRAICDVSLDDEVRLNIAASIVNCTTHSEFIQPIVDQENLINHFITMLVSENSEEINVATILFNNLSVYPNAKDVISNPNVIRNLGQVVRNKNINQQTKLKELGVLTRSMSDNEPKYKPSREEVANIFAGYVTQQPLTAKKFLGFATGTSNVNSVDTAMVIERTFALMSDPGLSYHDKIRSLKEAIIRKSTHRDQNQRVGEKLNKHFPFFTLPVIAELFAAEYKKAPDDVVKEEITSHVTTILGSLEEAKKPWFLSASGEGQKELLEALAQAKAQEERPSDSKDRLKAPLLGAEGGGAAAAASTETVSALTIGFLEKVVERTRLLAARAAMPAGGCAAAGGGALAVAHKGRGAGWAKAKE